MFGTSPPSTLTKSRVTRRKILRALVGVGIFAGLPSVAEANDGEFDPSGSVGIEHARDVALDESRTVAFIAVREGFVVVDVSTLSKLTVLTTRRQIPQERGESFTLQYVGSVSVSGNRLLVAGPTTDPEGDHASGFLLYDVSTPSDPEWVTEWKAGDSVGSAFLDGDTAYVASEMNPGALTIVSANDFAPKEIAEWSVTDAERGWETVPSELYHPRNVFVLDDVAFVACGEAGTWLLDVSDPEAPTALTKLGGRTASEIETNDGGVEDELEHLPGNSSFAHPNEDGTLLAVARRASDDADTEQIEGPGGVSLWNVSDPTASEYLLTLAPPTDEGERDDPGAKTAGMVGFDGSRLYTSWSRGGVRVFDLSEPMSPTLVAEWSNYEDTDVRVARPLPDGILALSRGDPTPPPETPYSSHAKLLGFPKPESETATSADVFGSVAKDGGRRVPETTTTTQTRRETGTTTRPRGSTTDAPTGYQQTNTSASAENDHLGGRFGLLALGGTLFAGGIAAWRRFGADGDESSRD
jgi:hypothetical protein